jgi:hypothetical protein
MLPDPPLKASRGHGREGRGMMMPSGEINVGTCMCNVTGDEDCLPPPQRRVIGTLRGG